MLLTEEEYQVETINDARWIPLTQGKFALVDKEDYPTIILNNWCAQKRNSGFGYYAVRSIHLNNPKERVRIPMHRQILNAPDGWEVDHINGDGLDNRKCNLRLCTRSQNGANRHKVRGNFKGVCWYSRCNKWGASICHDRKRYHLGYFDKELEAAKAYDDKAIELFGEFARLNLAV